MSISKRVEKYISERPSVLDCLKKDIINYSELSRQICAELGIKKFDAALIACRRYFWKLKRESLHENEIMRLVKSSKLIVKNKIIVAIIEKPRDLERVYGFQKRVRKEKGDFNLIEGTEVITMITNETYTEDIRKEFSNWLIKITSDAAEFIIIFDKKIENTSGVVSYVYNLLAEYGINILEEMSCWTDLLIVIDRKDTARAMGILAF